MAAEVPLLPSEMCFCGVAVLIHVVLVICLRWSSFEFLYHIMVESYFIAGAHCRPGLCCFRCWSCRWSLLLRRQSDSLTCWGCAWWYLPHSQLPAGQRPPTSGMSPYWRAWGDLPASLLCCWFLNLLIVPSVSHGRHAVCQERNLPLVLFWTCCFTWKQTSGPAAFMD